MLRILTILALFILPSVAMAEPYLVDTEASTIEYEGTHDGNTFVGQFKKWRANIVFDENALENSSIFVEIDTSSGDTGNGFYDGTLKNKDWFHVKKFPHAQFTSKDITKNEDGSFTAKGELQIKDIKKPLSFNFTLSKPSATTVQAISEFVIQRLDYAIGAESDGEGAWVSKDITLRFDLMTTPNSLSLVPEQ